MLDFGCGTATLTLMIESAHPFACVVGVDVDARSLTIGVQKIKEAKSKVQLLSISPGRIPIGDATFDRVVSSLVFHHLPRKEKLIALGESYRLLRPGGQLHMADWGKPGNLLLRGGFLLTHFLDGFETTVENVHGLLPELIKQSGLHSVVET